jgi:hypothetical protein
MWRLKGGAGISVLSNRTLVLGEVIKENNRMEFRPSEALEPLVTYEVEIVSFDDVIYSWQFTVMPSDLSLCRNYPNPFDMTKYDRITIGPVPAGASLKIYTLDGMLVKILNESNGNVIWDGKNSKGSKVASGIYIWVAENGPEKKIEKMTVIR